MGIPGCARHEARLTDQSTIEGIAAPEFDEALAGDYAFVLEWREIEAVTEVPFRLVMNPAGHQLRAGNGQPGCGDLIFVDFAIEGEKLAGRIVGADRAYGIFGGQIDASTFVQTSLVPPAAIPAEFSRPQVTEFRIYFRIRTAPLLSEDRSDDRPLRVGRGKGSVRFTYATGRQGVESELAEAHGTIATVSVVRH